MRYIYSPKWNFHNAPSITVCVQDPVYSDIQGGPAFMLTKAQARRIEKHFCGITECRCNSGGIVQENEEGSIFSIPAMEARTK